VVAPLTDYGWRFSREFVRKADEQGSQVLHQDWYVPGETRDFTRVFAEVRRAAEAVEPAVGFPSEPDTTSGEPAAGAEPAAGTGSEVPTMGFSEPEVTGIEGIAIVVESFEDARLIVPQLHYHRIRTQILGNDTWYQPEAIRLMPAAERAYFEGVVLVSGYLESHPTTRAFADAFRRRYGRVPGYAAYGYDAIRLLAAAWQDSGGDPAELGARLAAVTGYDGASGLISFAPDHRANTELHLLRVDARGDLRPIGEYR
jgi:ABC-type branched-subunit amino acid transport system substrate-binding protein